MSDRDALLAAIRARPNEDTPRLMYADFLDGLDAPTDLDRATAEFIRLSCAMRFGGDAMPQAAYRWLLTKPGEMRLVPAPALREPLPASANWRRLVPSALAEHFRLGPTAPLLERRKGREVWCQLRLTIPTAARTRDDPYYRATPARFWFRRGFCEGFKVCHAGARALLAPLVLADQPLCRVLTPDLKESALSPQTAPAASLVTREGK